MTSLKRDAIDVEPIDQDPDTFAVADGDGFDRPVRQPPSAAAVKINVEGLLSSTTRSLATGMV